MREGPEAFVPAEESGSFFVDIKRTVVRRVITPSFCYVFPL